MDAIGRELVKDFNKLLVDRKACIWVAPADCDHLSKDYHLPHYGLKDGPCMRCRGNLHSAPITDCTANAKWRNLLYTPQDLIAKPLSTHWLLEIKGVSHYTLVYDPMHCQEIGSTSHAVANVLYDVFYKELKGSNATKHQKLNELISEAYDTAGVPPDKRMKWIGQKNFADKGAPHQNYPDLQQSVIKARKTRWLVPAALELCKKFTKNGDDYSSRRCYCLQNLADSYDIVDRNPLFLPEPEYRKYKKCITNFLNHYTALAVRSARSTSQIGKYQWSVTPKFHFLFHILEDAKYLSPKSFWCYGGESMVGIVTGMAQSCLHGMPPWRVTETICVKYRVNKHLLFSEIGMVK
jgi:hypothetical protein